MTGRSDEKTGNGQTDRKKGTKERVHRVGTVTFGVVLILFGILFLLHLFFPVLEYRFIFRLWPVVLIGMGTEALAAQVVGQKRFAYDWAAVVMLFLLLVFAMGMAAVDYAMELKGCPIIIWQ